MIKGVDSNARGQEDDGADRARRLPRCSKEVWCTEQNGHRAGCVAIPRGAATPPDFGPGRKR